MNKHVPPDTLTFEPGKTYRTRNGRLMKITAIRSDSLAGTEKNPDPSDSHIMIYSRSGIADGLGWSGFDLLPGAIEDEKPTFKVGKSYRTRRGDVVKIVRQLRGPDYPLQGEHHNQCWTLDGRYWKQAKAECSADLMPGAIEDEPAPEPTIDREAIQIDAIQAQTTDLFRQLRGVRERARNEEQEGQQRDEKLASHAEAIQQLQADAIARNERELNAAFDQMNEPQTADTARRETNQLAIAANETAERVDNIEKHCEAMQARIEERSNADDKVLANHSERLMNLQDRINELENYTGLDVRSAKRRSIVELMQEVREGQKNAQRAAMLDQLATKPTIKGGWVNVYPAFTSDRMRLSVLAYDSRASANDAAMPGRIACIQIPDITEGEGL